MNENQFSLATQTLCKQAVKADKAGRFVLISSRGPGINAPQIR